MSPSVKKASRYRLDIHRASIVRLPLIDLRVNLPLQHRLDRLPEQVLQRLLQARRRPYVVRS